MRIVGRRRLQPWHQCHSALEGTVHTTGYRWIPYKKGQFHIIQEGVLHILPVWGLCSHVGLCCYWSGNVIWPGWCEQSRWHIIMLLLSLLTDTPRLSLAAWQGCSRWSVPCLPFCSSLSSWHWRDLWKETHSGQVLLSFNVKAWGLRWFLARFLGGEKKDSCAWTKVKNSCNFTCPCLLISWCCPGDLSLCE